MGKVADQPDRAAKAVSLRAEAECASSAERLAHRASPKMARRRSWASEHTNPTALSVRPQRLISAPAHVAVLPQMPPNCLPAFLQFAQHPTSRASATPEFAFLRLGKLRILPSIQAQQEIFGCVRTLVMLVPPLEHPRTCTLRNGASAAHPIRSGSN
jgi:hypothetical protein